MVFSSITFLIYFLPIVIFLYYAAPAGMKNLLLLVTSLFFYAWGEPVYVFLMVFSILINYVTGILIDRQSGKEDGIPQLKRQLRKKGLVLLNVICNLGILGFFKYADFITDNINALLGSSIQPLELPLPIGISFYTFQAMSYIIDLYRGNVKVQKNLVAFGTYIALFPQLIAGPIVRFKSIEEQLMKRSCSIHKFASGVRLFIIGMGKKVLLANNIGMLWESVSGLTYDEISAASAWLGAIAFTMQIYFDFSGYSDMATGLGRMFGFEFPKNFEYPYMSKSITEFWRRWHISLGSWFKEYVYVPLGGNRKGIKRQTLNIVIVWSLTGLWHGASWNFVIWGTYFAVLLILEKLFLGQMLENLRKKHIVFGTVMSGIYTMLFVIISWVIFASESAGFIGHYLESMFFAGNGGLIDGTAKYLFGNNLVLLIFCTAGCTEMPKKLALLCGEKMSIISPKLAGMSEIIMLVLIFTVSFAYIVASTYNPFLYFRF